MSKLYVDNINPNSSWTGEEIAGNTVSPPGAILQVVQGEMTDIFTCDSTSFEDTGLTASITPTSTSSKILVTVNAAVGHGGGTYTTLVRLMRDSTPVGNGVAVGSREAAMAITGDNYAHVVEFVGTTYLDSPNTTSAINYKLQMKVQAADHPSSLNKSTGDPDAAYAGRYASYITLMEIAG